MTSQKPGKQPGQAPEQGAPEKLAQKVAEVASNPQAYAAVFDVFRVPPNGDARFTAWAGDIPQADFVNGAQKWLSSTLGPGTWRIDVKDNARLHAGSVLVPVAVDQRPPELRQQQTVSAPAATSAAPAGGGFDMAAVMVAMIQSQSAQQAAMFQAMTSNKGDDIDRLLKMRELLKPDKPASESSTTPAELLKLGVEFGKKLSDKGGAMAFLEEHADKIFDNVEAGIQLVRDLAAGRPKTAQVVDAKATSETTAAPTPSLPDPPASDDDANNDGDGEGEGEGDVVDVPPEASNG